MRPRPQKSEFANSEFQTLRNLPIPFVAADRAKSGTVSGREPTRAEVDLGPDLGFMV